MKILTANRLSDGEAVWFSLDHRWVETIERSEIARDKAAEDRLEAFGRAGIEANLVIDVNLIDVETVDGEIVPTRLRERIRAAGPTTHPAFGKQARPGISRAA